MISLETAKRLKEARLKWEPKDHDFCIFDPRGIFSDSDKKMFCLSSNPCGDSLTTAKRLKELNMGDKELWLPRLDQLLAEIEKRGYWWNLCAKNIFMAKNYGTEWQESTSINADTPDEAAAAALIWILEREKTVRPPSK